MIGEPTLLTAPFRYGDNDETAYTARLCAVVVNKLSVFLKSPFYRTLQMINCFLTGF